MWISPSALAVARSEWRGHVTVPEDGRIPYVPLTKQLAEVLKSSRALRGPRVVCNDAGEPLTQRVVQVVMRRAARRANVKGGVHILRHTFCSRLAMRGALARAIQELAGHQDLSTTQRCLSPAALDAAIRTCVPMMTSRSAARLAASATISVAVSPSRSEASIVTRGALSCSTKALSSASRESRSPDVRTIG